ncbi:hypothetical protein PR002_g17647 [Phytophthora rubi]|uniref:Uncharacterized protein n=1 Tax=Phytophthora rubi TaxID=129364 RepID=A0A6A3K4G5_9STRA|nr:hypothetical protein PR002_g17647 [Phytophthora rubi]
MSGVVAEYMKYISPHEHGGDHGGTGFGAGGVGADVVHGGAVVVIVVESAFAPVASEVKYFVAVLGSLLVVASALEPMVLLVEPSVAEVAVVVVVVELPVVVVSAPEPMVLVVKPKVAEVAVVEVLMPPIVVVSALEQVVSWLETFVPILEQPIVVALAMARFITVASVISLLASVLEWFVAVVAGVEVLGPLLVVASAREPTVLVVERRVAVVMVVVAFVTVLELLVVVASALKLMVLVLVVEPRVAEVADVVAIVAILELLTRVMQASVALASELK